MSDAWDDKRKAQEEEFFDKANKQALERIRKQRNEARLSPITGKPMEQMTVMGVVIDRCQDSGGIWLDAGELDQLIKASQGQASGEGWMSQFLGQLFKTKS